MERNDIYQMLTATRSPLEISRWLRNDYFPEIVVRFNTDNSRKRFGLYQNEKIPVNERNLTDVRTRMGVLIEFEIARISNELLSEFGIDDIFWCYVVANRFPDLEVRKNTGERLLRLEIKCLQCIAEEKSANFDTLKKDIDPSTDFVVVCLWDWFKEPSTTCNWDSVPKIVKVYTFHAYSLAMLRDTYWLNNPPSNLGSGYQGFDIRYAVTCANGIYSKEQGNYGKLTRIWREGFTYRPRETAELLDTEQEYLSFQHEIIFEGFKILAYSHLSELSKASIEDVYYGTTLIGYKSTGILYMLSSLIETRRQQELILNLCNQNNIDIVIVMTNKYRCTIYSAENNTLEQKARDEKPKNVVEIINHF